MTTADFYFFSSVPEWQSGSGRRLNIAMLFASVLIVAAFSAIRIQGVSDLTPLPELVVQLIENTTEAATEPERRDVRSGAQPGTEAVQPVFVTVARRPVAATSDATPVAEAPEVDDWHEFGTKIVKEIIANPQKQYTVNPPFDEKRRVAAIKFRPSQAPVKREIWDNVEKDQFGRTILRDGNRFRVLDDPSAVNREIFEKYEQHMVYFTIPFAKAAPHELPWVNEIREQYAYLRLREEQRRNPEAF